MGKQDNKDHLAQGPGGGGKSKANGSHLNQGPTDAQHGGDSGSHLDQGEGGARFTQDVGTHRTPHPALTDMTSDRQGGTVRGHDRTNPNAGKRKGGDPMRVHPSLTRKR